MRINFNKIGFFILAGCLALPSCNEEATDISTVTKFEPFTINGLPDKIILNEVDEVHTINFTFDEKQIIEFGLVVEAHGGTATDEQDYSLITHDVHVLALEGKGAIELQINHDIIKEDDENFFITFTSDYALGLPLTKTIEVVIKNCPEYVHSQFVGDYTVVSDGWQDYTTGSTVTLTDLGLNKLGFKYNCGADAESITLSVDPATTGVSGDKQNYCKYVLTPNTPPTQFLGDVVEASSKVNVCDKILTISIAHTDDKGTAYGTGSIVLKKK